MVKHNGSCVQPLCYHDGTYANPLTVRPMLTMGGTHIIGFLIKATAANAGGGSVRVQVNGTFVTNSISLPSGLESGATRMIYLKPSDYPNGKIREILSTDRVMIIFTSSPSNIRLGVIYA